MKKVVLLFGLFWMLLGGNSATAIAGSYSEGALMACDELNFNSLEDGKVASDVYGPVYGIGCGDHFETGFVFEFMLKNVQGPHRLMFEIWDNDHGYLNRTLRSKVEGVWHSEVVTEYSELSAAFQLSPGGEFDVVTYVDYGSGYVHVSNELIWIENVDGETLPTTSVQGSSLGGDFNLLRVGSMLFAGGDVSLEVSLTGKSESFIDMQEKNCLLTDKFNNGEKVIVRKKGDPANVFEAEFSSTNQTITALTPGWHLKSLSFPSPNALSEYAKLGNIWAWRGGTWGVFLPGKADGGKSYAESKGFFQLDSLCAGMGFWIDVASGGVVSLPMAIPN